MLPGWIYTTIGLRDVIAAPPGPRDNTKALPSHLNGALIYVDRAGPTIFLLRSSPICSPCPVRPASCRSPARLISARTMIGCRKKPVRYALVREEETVMTGPSSGALFPPFVNMGPGPLRWLCLHDDDRPEFFPYTATRIHHSALAGSIALRLFERWKLKVFHGRFC